ncbi:hypothetical protein D3C85_951240 [compost metagenome]
MIKKPYSAARPKAFPFSDPLVKKLTVNGSMGKMQGISRAAKPPTKPAIKIPQRVFCASGCGASFFETVVVLSATLLIVSVALTTVSVVSGLIFVKVRSSVLVLSCAYPVRDTAQKNSNPRQIFLKDIICYYLFYRDTEIYLLWWQTLFIVAYHKLYTTFYYSIFAVQLNFLLKYYRVFKIAYVHFKSCFILGNCLWFDGFTY